MKKIILILLCIFVGANLGHLVRYVIVQNIPNDFPLAILFCNILGSFLLGLFYARKTANTYVIVFIGVAFLGTLTTFSTYIHDIFLILINTYKEALHLPMLIQNELSSYPITKFSVWHAIFYCLMSIVLCLICVYLGRKLGLLFEKHE